MQGIYLLIFQIFLWLCLDLAAAGELFIVVWGLLSSLGLSCPSACGILIPQPGIEPVSPALEGGFLTTGPSGKSWPMGLIVKA